MSPWGLPVSNGRNGDVLLGLSVGLVSVLLYCIWKVSAVMGLAPQTVVAVVFRLSFPALLFVGSAYAGRWYEPVRLGNAWPFVLAAFWWAIWPALDDFGGRFAFGPPVSWWASDGVQWSVLGLIVLGGFGWVWWRSRR